MNNISMFLKRLFCDHIWKEEENVFLRKERLRDGGEFYGLPTSSDFEFYGIKQKCIKCGKTKYIEKRIMIL